MLRRNGETPFLWLLSRIDWRYCICWHRFNSACPWADKSPALGVGDCLLHALFHLYIRPLGMSSWNCSQLCSWDRSFRLKNRTKPKDPLVLISGHFLWRIVCFVCWSMVDDEHTNFCLPLRSSARESRTDSSLSWFISKHNRLFFSPLCTET